MTQTYSRVQKPVFGRAQGSGVASSRQYRGSQQRAPQQRTTQPYSPPANGVPQNPQYAEILGNGFSGSAGYSGGGGANLRPVKGKRFLSGLIDFCIVSCLGGIILTLQHGIGAGLPELINGGLLKFYTWFAIACFIYGFSMEASPAQGTVGKLATGTVVVNENGQRMTFGQALGRNLGKFVTYIVPLYIGYLMVLWTRKNQSLHDKMSGTIVCSKRGVSASYAETFA